MEGWDRGFKWPGGVNGHLLLLAHKGRNVAQHDHVGGAAGLAGELLFEPGILGRVGRRFVHRAVATCASGRVI